MLNCFCCKSADITGAASSSSDAADSGRISDLPSKVADTALAAKQRQQQLDSAVAPITEAPVVTATANQSESSPPSVTATTVDQSESTPVVNKPCEQSAKIEQVHLVDGAGDRVDYNKNEVDLLIAEARNIAKVGRCGPPALHCELHSVCVCLCADVYLIIIYLYALLCVGASLYICVIH